MFLTISRLSLVFLSITVAHLGAEPMQWPTPYPSDALAVGDLDWGQPTISGRQISATFGCVRNEGAKFHEALDIPPY